jgi:hypothetical protein
MSHVECWICSPWRWQLQCLPKRSIIFNIWYGSSPNAEVVQTSWLRCCDVTTVSLLLYENKDVSSIKEAGGGANQWSLKMTVFWNVGPCSLVDTDRRIRGAYCLTYSLIALMLEAVRTSGTSVSFYQTTRPNIPDDSHLHTRRRENLKSHIVGSCFKTPTRKGNRVQSCPVLVDIPKKFWK